MASKADFRIKAPSGRKIQSAYPFLKWAGGKSQLLGQFETMFPKAFNGYLEPFIGGGAVLFHLLNKNPDRAATLSDSNEDLINCYRCVRDEVEDVIDALKKHRNDIHHFYKIRAQDVKKLSNAERAARLIFLNKTCFNGLYRVNRKGQFNVPFGRYKNPKICDEQNLRTVSRALTYVQLYCKPFDSVLERAAKGDFVYFDPPYQPLTNTSNFTSYTSKAFAISDQQRLADVFKALSDRGCHVMLSNSDNEIIRDLYREFRIEEVMASRAINSNPQKRGKITELLILNY